MAAFASTGPHGHRQRMRDKLVANGADTLADYELIEMLLFLGIPRRDTKPLAKAALNQFGSLPAVVAAPAEALRQALSIGDSGVAAFRLVGQAARRLAATERRDRPVLRDWDGLCAYLDAASSAPGLRALFLNNRNQLLADELHDADGFVAAVLGRALDLHATALIAVRSTAERSGKQDVALGQALSEAGGLLTIVLHEFIHGRPGAWDGLRRARRL